MIVTDDLPGTVTFISATPDQGNCGHTNGVVTCALGSITSGARVSVVVVVRADSERVIINTARVIANESDPNPSNNGVSEDTTVVSDSPPPTPPGGPPDITGVSPVVLLRNSTDQVTISGSNFPQDISVLICRIGGVTITNIEVVDSNTIVVDASVGLPQENRCGVRVNAGGERDILRNAFSMQ